MNQYFNNYLEGNYEVGKLYFAEAVEGSEWGVDFRLIEDDIRDNYETCLVFRKTNPMVDEEWEIGTFMNIVEALEIVKENFEEFQSRED